MESCEDIANYADNGSIGQRRILILLFLGFFVALLGIVILTITAILSGPGSTGLGVVIFIGPIPIVIGAGPQAEWLILFAIILTVLSIIVFAAMRKHAR